jgi:hypothetical protein
MRNLSENRTLQDLQGLLYSESLKAICNICRIGSGRFPTTISKTLLASPEVPPS